MRFVQLIMAILALTSLPLVAHAETRALLIGVSDYDESIGLRDLKGPANDVRLLEATLRGRGVRQINILADGIQGSPRPTRAAILSAFDDLAAQARDGDFVFIHLSGHGTRQHDRNGDEADGLDEVFLPVDTARAEPGAGQIPNAITDDEIGAAMAAIRAKGADVWLVLDSCHAGSGTRGTEHHTATRFVAPAILGVRAEPVYLAEDILVEQTAETLPGGFLAFYSAQSTELAREVNFARDSGGDEWYGLFTAKLATRLQTSDGLSFRQLFQAVLSDLNDTSLPGVARLQTPLWEGDLIDAALFGGQDTAGLRRFAIENGVLSAGAVHGITKGTLLGLVADTADAPDAVIGYAQVGNVIATAAKLRAVTADCTPSAGAPCPSAGRLPGAARFAQVIALPSDKVIRFARPRDFQTGVPVATSDPMVRALYDAIAAAQDHGGPAVAISDTEFDIDVVLAGDALWFGPQNAQQPTGPSWRTESGPPLIALLTRIAKAETLARVLDNANDSGSRLNPSPIRVDTAHFTAPIGSLAALGANIPPRSECKTAHKGLSDAAKRPLPDSARLKQCDTVDFTVQADVTGAHDVNRIHIDAQYCVYAAHERIEGIANARPLGPGMVMCSDCPKGFLAGAERLYVLVTKSLANAEPLNLEGLIETCDPVSPTRGPAANEAQSFFEALAKRPGTRGAFGRYNIDDIWVDTWRWRVLPRRDAFLAAGRPPEDDQ